MKSESEKGAKSDERSNEWIEDGQLAWRLPIPIPTYIKCTVPIGTRNNLGK